MVDATHRRYIASDRSYYAIVKRDVHALAIADGFDKKRIAELDLIIAEITSNLNKYAIDGELLIGSFKESGQEYIEIICIDNGPGMIDINRMLSDGYSTANTLGHGLGSVKRLSDQFDIFSQKGWGTILLSRVYKQYDAPKRPKDVFEINPLIVAKPLETVSGDAFYLKTTDPQFSKLMLADGLGHGREANFAVNEAVKAFRNCPYHTPSEIIRHIHTEVRKTRGLVATVVVFDKIKKQITLTGVGNIASKVFGPLSSKGHLAYNGIIGHNIPNTMNDTLIDTVNYNELILCSDGIRSRWDVGKYPGIFKCDPSIRAAAIYKDFARQTDDMSVVIAKFRMS